MCVCKTLQFYSVEKKSFKFPGKIPGFIIPTKGFDHRFIIGQGTNAVYLIWPYDTASTYYAQCLIATVDYNCQGNFFNDARADASGRLWTGELYVQDSKLYDFFKQNVLK